MKNLLKIMLVIGVTVIYVILNNSLTDKAVKDCVSGGNSETFCVENLNK